MIHRSTDCHTKHRAGFTLIELLVVVSIIALLIAILLPAFSKARASARKTQCLTQLRSVFLATSLYADEQGRLPPLNNEDDEGAWQYNYLIYDGRDYESNFGPLARPGGPLKYIEELYCPVQQDPFYKLATKENPWPAVRNRDTRAGYARRFHLSGKAFSEFRKPKAFASDLMHLPEVVRSAHKTGLNAVFTDGHAEWVPDPGIFTKNALAKPFDPADNKIVRKIWQVMDRKGR